MQIHATNPSQQYDPSNTPINRLVVFLCWTAVAGFVIFVLSAMAGINLLH